MRNFGVVFRHWISSMILIILVACNACLANVHSSDESEVRASKDLPYATAKSLEDSTDFDAENRQIAKELLLDHGRKSTFFLHDTVYWVNYGNKPIRVSYRVSDNTGDRGHKRLLLLLPGWNYPDTQWCSGTKVCSVALYKGYDLLFIEMGKSVYMDSLYPQMRNDYRAYPTRIWLWDSVLKPLQKRGYFSSGLSHKDPIIPKNFAIHTPLFQGFFVVPTFVMGLSTGARGSLLLALEHPEAFSGCAGLSGDYNPELQPNDNLMINCMGPMNLFQSHWRGSNNIYRRAKELKVPCFLAHGSNDLVVPILQTKQFANALLKKKSPFQNQKNEQLGQKKRDTMDAETKLEEAYYRELQFFYNRGKHDYNFWSEASLKALIFFDELNK